MQATAVPVVGFVRDARMASARGFPGASRLAERPAGCEQLREEPPLCTLCSRPCPDCQRDKLTELLVTWIMLLLLSVFQILKVFHQILP